jgi:hypothetical protein
VPSLRPRFTYRYHRHGVKYESHFETQEAAVAKAVKDFQEYHAMPVAILIDGRRVMDVHDIVELWEEKYLVLEDEA